MKFVYTLSGLFVLVLVFVSGNLYHQVQTSPSFNVGECVRVLGDTYNKYKVNLSPNSNVVELRFPSYKKLGYDLMVVESNKLVKVNCQK